MLTLIVPKPADRDSEPLDRDPGIITLAFTLARHLFAGRGMEHPASRSVLPRFETEADLFMASRLPYNPR